MEEADELRIKIAKLLGWKFVENTYGWDTFRPDGSNDTGASMMRTEELAIRWARIPDWTHDWNAAGQLLEEMRDGVHFPELVCDSTGWRCNITPMGNGGVFVWGDTCPTPQEAIARTYLTWKEAQAVEDGG
jgi:hypothetical protein